MPRPSPAQLIVEGKDDRHVIWALCKQHQVAETFTVEIPGSGEGIDALFKSIPVRLKIAGLRAMGIVVDANQSLQARWETIRGYLKLAGYKKLPRRPEVDGFIATPSAGPRVGVWLMPDNRLPGMLEDFAARLIPEGDPLTPRAEACLENIEREGLNRYRSTHRPKALIHTWLAWQENPGRPMGQAITAHVLRHDSTLAMASVAWLNRLFNK
jgi:hypothetical protein